VEEKEFLPLPGIDVDEPLEVRVQNVSFLQLIPYDHIPYVTSVTREWVCPLWTGLLPFVTCTYPIYCMILNNFRFTKRIVRPSDHTELG
jgi:hypothetical protein